MNKIYELLLSKPFPSPGASPLPTDTAPSGNNVLIAVLVAILVVALLFAAASNAKGPGK